MSLFSKRILIDSFFSPCNIMVRIPFPQITRLWVVDLVLTLLRDLEHVQARGSFILDC